MFVPPRTIDVIVTGLHLRWGGVWQRPNHILERLAKYVPIVVLEEPLFDSSGVDAVETTTANNLTIVTPHRRHVANVTDAESLRVVSSLVGNRRPLVWLYTPMMIEIADLFPGAPLVFDKMDELSAFAGADPRIGVLEGAVLGRADLVFAGGNSLYRTVRDRAARARNYPSGVDVDHFGRAATAAPHPKLRSFAGRPVFGYIGVIDERVDLDLIADIADARPDAIVAMVGPVVKIPNDALPQRANIAYLGKAEYDELPALLAGFDVALMPFALNRHTENISPTKTLEYLASGKPVVSTAVPDVVEDFDGIVHIAATRNAFIRALEAAQRPNEDRQRLAEAKVLDRSWDAIVLGMCADLAACGIRIADVSI